MPFKTRTVLCAILAATFVLIQKKSTRRMAFTKAADILGWLFRGRPAQPVALKLSAASLISLPPELLTEVLKEVGWREVLRLRQTCRTLDRISRSKYIWKRLLSVHAEEHAVPWGGLEKPPELYDAKELERLFLRWKSVETSLKQDACTSLREDKFTLSSSIEDVHVLRGGRWVLLRTKMGDIYCCDLEAPRISPTLLIPCPFNTATWIYSEMSVDETRDTALLSFSIATFSEVIDSDWRNSKEDLRPRIDVYRATLVLDSQHNATEFDVATLSTFRPGYLEAIVMAVELRGPHLARLIRPNPSLHLQDYIDVFDWALSNDSAGIPRKYILNENTILSMRLLPDSRILIGQYRSVTMLDLSEFPESIEHPEAFQPHPTLPRLWSMDIDVRNIRFSPVFTRSDKHHIIFQTAGIITGVSWSSCDGPPADIDAMPLYRFSLPPVVDQYTQAPDFSYHYGAAWSSKLRKPVFIRFNWLGEDLSFKSGITGCDVTNRWEPDKMYMESISGRLVYLASSYLYIAQFGSIR